MICRAEMHNVYDLPAYATVQAELKTKLFLWYMQTSDVTPWLEDPRQGGWNPSPQASAQRVRDGEVRRGAFFDVGADSLPNAVVYHDDALSA
jgi:hypothetical protein